VDHGEHEYFEGGAEVKDGGEGAAEGLSEG